MREFEHKKIATPSPSPFFGPKIQKKLTTGTVGDKYETEADNVADKVVNKRKTGGLLQSRSEEAIQQKPISETISTVQKQDLAQEKPLQKKGKEKEEDKKVQKKSDKEEDKKVQKKGEKEEDKKVQKKSDKEEDKKVQKKGEKEEDKKVQKKSDKEEDKKVQKKGEKEEDKKVQKKCAECEGEDKNVQKKDKKEEEKPVQKKEQNSETEIQNNALERKLDSSKGSGTGLDKKTKKEMESGFGSDFSNVKIHTDASAVQMSQELGAQAFTNGNHVYFNEGKYNPSSQEGKHLLAHELTHTVQQTGAKQKSGTIQKSSIENHPEDLQAERPQNPQFKGNPPLEKANDNQMLISTGQKGNYVAELQQGLLEAGQSLPKFGADGDFGSETRNAVIGFQTDNNLNKIDGLVGPETIGALDNVLVAEKGGKKEPPPCSRKDFVAILGGTFTNQISGTFFAEEGCENRLKIVAQDLHDNSETGGCNAFDVHVDGKLRDTINPTTKKKTTFVSLPGLKKGKHTISLTIPPFCNAQIKASVSIK
ncbi:eCIS core domain-containing protein [Flavobacterium sp. UBA7680]|uniref:eCIS core domain-containing protein n=1 Tax=Flavobacterium sp. UBA7680 TaxID=1946559 RepID=UPI0025C6F2AF|nr:DUF4157 domain-containing protein [Flavobacterium sp. UBA7680]